MKCSVVLLLAVGLAIGCTRSDTVESKAKPARSSAETLIDGFTGRTAVNAGKKATEDITRISEQHNRDLEAVME